MNRFGNGNGIPPQLPHGGGMHNMVNGGPGMNRNMNVNMSGLGGAGLGAGNMGNQQPGQPGMAGRQQQVQSSVPMGRVPMTSIPMTSMAMPNANRGVQPGGPQQMGVMNGGRGAGVPPNPGQFPPSSMGMRAGPPQGMAQQNLGGMPGGGAPGGQSLYNPSSDLLAMLNKSGAGANPLGGVKGVEVSGVKGGITNTNPNPALNLNVPTGSPVDVLEGTLPPTSTPFDMSEFPSLGAGPARLGGGGGGGAGGLGLGGVGGVGGGGLLDGGQQSYQHIIASGVQNMGNSNLDEILKRPTQGPAVKEEDFPALTATVKGGGAMGVGASSGMGGVATSMAQENFMRGGSTDRSAAATAGFSTQQSRQPWAAQPGGGTASKAPGGGTAGDGGAPGGNKTDRFGLLGLLGVIHMTDANLNMLALGQDLTSLGLNLNSPECLYATFESPWADFPNSRREPDFCIPLCYYMQPPALKTSHFSKFHLETLFYIFYNMPGDQMQLYAAQELYNRDWRYHTEMKTWFSRAPNTELQHKTAQHERGSYVYFDVTSWERVQKDNFMLSYDQLEDRTFFEKPLHDR